MGLFSGSPDLDSPSGVTDYMLRNDKNPAVRYFKKDKGGLTLEIEAAWTGKSREQRLGELKNATRYFLMFTQPDTTPFDKLPPQLMRPGFHVVVISGIVDLRRRETRHDGTPEEVLRRAA